MFQYIIKFKGCTCCFSLLTGSCNTSAGISNRQTFFVNLKIVVKKLLQTQKSVSRKRSALSVRSVFCMPVIFMSVASPGSFVIYNTYHVLVDCFIFKYRRNQHNFGGIMSYSFDTRCGNGYCKI